MSQFKSPESASQFKNLNSELRQLVEEALAARAYRARYNNREDVKEKRKEYMKARNDNIKAALALLKGQKVDTKG